jgi:hypothetical protein
LSSSNKLVLSFQTLASRLPTLMVCGDGNDSFAADDSLTPFNFCRSFCSKHSEEDSFNAAGVRFPFVSAPSGLGTSACPKLGERYTKLMRARGHRRFGTTEL